MARNAVGQEPWRRALIGAALAIVLFTVLTLPTWFLISAGTGDGDAWSDLGYVALMIFVLLVLPPVALGTALLGGMPIDRRTRAHTARHAAVWFAYLAAVPAVLAAGIAFVSGPIAPWLPFATLIIPAMAAGYIARMVIDKVMGNRTVTMVVLAVTAVVAVAPLFMLGLTRFGGV